MPSLGYNLGAGTLSIVWLLQIAFCVETWSLQHKQHFRWNFQAPTPGEINGATRKPQGQDRLFDVQASLPHATKYEPQHFRY